MRVDVGPQKMQKGAQCLSSLIKLAQLNFIYFYNVPQKWQKWEKFFFLYSILGMRVDVGPQKVKKDSWRRGQRRGVQRREKKFPQKCEKWAKLYF